MPVEEIRHAAVAVAAGGNFVPAVVFDRINHEVEVLLFLDEDLGEPEGVLDLHVAVHEAVLDLERVLQSVGVVHRARNPVGLLVVELVAVQDAARVTLVVVDPVGHRVERDPGRVLARVPEQRHQREEAAVGTAVDPDPVPRHPALVDQEVQERQRAVDVGDAHLPVGVGAIPVSVARTAPVIHGGGRIAPLDQVVGVDDAPGARPALDHRLRALTAAVGVDDRRSLPRGCSGWRVPDPSPGGGSVRQVVLDDFAVRPRGPVEGIGAALRDPGGLGASRSIHQVKVAEIGQRLADRGDAIAFRGNRPGVHPLPSGDLFEGAAARGEAVEVLLAGMFPAGGHEEGIPARGEFSASHFELSLGQRRHFTLEVREHQHGPATLDGSEGERLAVG